MAAALGTSAGNVFEVVPGRLTYAIVLPRRVAGALIYPPLPEDTATALYYPMEEFCLYYPFFLDYGPVPLNRLYRFCSKLQGLLATGRHVVLVSGSHAQRRANSTYLIAAHGLLFRGQSPAEALAPFRSMSPPLPPWHDASPQVDPFHLTTLDVLRGLERAKRCGFFSFQTFDLERFERFEAAENGDMNWLAEGRFLALAGPQDPQPGASPQDEGFTVSTVEQLLPTLKLFGVTALVRLNRKYYNERKVTAAGLAHMDLYFEDGSNPPEPILQKFLKFCESTPGAIGVREWPGPPLNALPLFFLPLSLFSLLPARPRSPRAPPLPPLPLLHRLQGWPGAHGDVHWRLPNEALQFYGKGGYWVDARVPPGQRHWPPAGLSGGPAGAHVGGGAEVQGWRGGAAAPAAGQRHGHLCFQRSCC